MDTHKRESSKKTGAATVAVTSVPNTHSLIRTDHRVANTPTTIIQTQPNTSISDNDLEIMFEKMHSDKAEIEGNANNTEGVVITSHESSTGGYTFNITMANQQDATANHVDAENVSLSFKFLLEYSIEFIRLIVYFVCFRRKINKMVAKG